MENPYSCNSRFFTIVAGNLLWLGYTYKYSG